MHNCSLSWDRWHSAERSSVLSEVGRLLTREHDTLDWPTLLDSLRHVAVTADGVARVSAAGLRPLAAFFVEVFALSSRVSLVLDDAELIDRVAGIFARHADPATLCVGADPDEQLLLDFAETAPEMTSLTSFPTAYATLRRCVQVTNDFLLGIAGSDARLADVRQYLTCKRDRSKVTHKTDKSRSRENTPSHFTLGCVQGYQIIGEEEPYMSGKFVHSEERGAECLPLV